MKLIIPILLLTALPAYAGQAVIVETDSGVSVEYNGQTEKAEPKKDPAATGTAAPAPASAISNPGQLARVRFLAAQLQQLNREIRDASLTTGSETDEQLAAKQTLVAGKRVSVEKFTEEYRQLTGSLPTDATDGQDAAAATYTQTPFMKQRSDREERVRNTRATRRTLTDPAP